MKLRKMLLLGAMAALALALAGPASAGAAEWKHGESPLEKHVEIGLFGSEVFVTEAGAMVCGVDATLTTEGGSSGEIGNYEATECMGLTGAMEGCTLASAEQVGGPWAVDVNATDLTVTGNTILRTFEPGCPVETIESTIPALTTTTPDPTAITELEYFDFGSGSASIDGGVASKYQVFGSWFLAGEASGTYGIG